MCTNMNMNMNVNINDSKHDHVFEYEHRHEHEHILKENFEIACISDCSDATVALSNIRRDSNVDSVNSLIQESRPLVPQFFL
jgi:hypothetical protein